MFNIDRKSMTILFIGLLLTIIIEALLLSGLIIVLPFDAYRFISMAATITLIGFVLVETKFFPAIKNRNMKMDLFRTFGIVSALLLLMMIIIETIINDVPKILSLAKPILLILVIISAIFESIKKR